MRADPPATTVPLPLAAVVQLTSRGDLVDNLARAEALVERACDRGAVFVALPENVALMGRERDKFAVAGAFEPGLITDHSGAIAAWARDLARRLDVELLLGGVPERSASGDRVHNACVLVAADGSIRARYRKIHLFDVALADGTVLRESASVAPGDEVVVADTRIGRLGLSVCYDVRFPELYRRLVDQGATVLAVPSAFTVTTGRDHWHVLLRARAIESQCHVLAPAQWGDHGNGRTTFGHALVCDPWGTVLAECADGEGVALAEVDPGRTRAVRSQLPALEHRRLR